MTVIQKTHAHFIYLAMIALLLSCQAMGCRKTKNRNEIPENLNKQPIASSFQFEDRTSSSGVNAIYRNGGDSGLRTMLETLGGGLGVIDFDRDEMPDLFINGGGVLSEKKEITGRSSFLYRNCSNWRFESCIEFATLETEDLYNHGAEVGDIDNDGFQDLIVTGYRGIMVFRNQGDGSFQRWHCGVDTDAWATSAAFSDFNGDGFLDLFVCNYLQWSFENHRTCPENGSQRDVCTPRYFEGEKDSLFMNQGDGTFLEESKLRGIDKNGKGLGVVAGDIDADGDVDIYVANDVTNNHFYVNDGKGHFIESGATSGVDTGTRTMPNGSMGTDLVDFDNDGLIDIGVANYEGEDFALYRQVRIGNSGRYFFDLASKRAKLTAVGQSYVGWGTLFEDFDGDGLPDLIVNNGHISYYPTKTTMAQPPLILKNNQGTFERTNEDLLEYFANPHHGRGLATADFDRDGDLDLAFANCNQNIGLLENTVDDGEKGRAKQRLIIVGTSINRDGLGMSINLIDRGKPLTSIIRGGGSYLSASQKELLVAKTAKFDRFSGKKHPVEVQEFGFLTKIVENHSTR